MNPGTIPVARQYSAAAVSPTRQDESLLPAAVIIKPLDNQTPSEARPEIQQKVAMKLKLIFALFAVAVCTQSNVFGGEQGDDNPTGVAGAFNGNITTAGNYDPYTGNGHRQIDEIVVPGSVGAYPLKWTRYWNSHITWQDNFPTGAAWKFSYIDYKYWTVGDQTGYNMPDGRVINIGPNDIYGVEEFFDSTGLRLPDGGTVTANNGNGQVIDPYGQALTISTTGTGSSTVTTISEPGGRYLQVNYNANGFVIQVQAFDGIAGHPALQSVSYTWKPFTLHWSSGPVNVPVLTDVAYSDGTSAHYTYFDAAYQGPPVCSSPYIRSKYHAAVVATADDVRYAGPMRRIAYTYDPGANQTRIVKESRLKPDGTLGEMVSSIANIGAQPTETRGDGAQRSFSYNKAQGCKDCPPPDGPPCPTPAPLDGKMASFTDFSNPPHTTTLSYGTDATQSSAGFITAVKDPNGHVTQYTRQTGSWGITTITHPDLSTIQQTFWPTTTHDAESAPWYLASRTDELFHTTVYKRDGNYRIIEKDYPNDADEPASSETFTYNPFGEVLTHRLTNGGTEYFAYDTRGLKTTYTDATGSGPGDPAHTTYYTYYTSGPWTDRLATVTHPPTPARVQPTENNRD